MLMRPHEFHLGPGLRCTLNFCALRGRGVDIDQALGVWWQGLKRRNSNDLSIMLFCNSESIAIDVRGTSPIPVA